jgi:hypothetical protein
LLAKEILQRSREPFYNFIPYFNRTDDKPSFQWEFLAAASSYKGRVVLAANRTGKSDIGAYDMCLAITGQHPYRKYPNEGNAIIVGLDFNMIRDVDLPAFRKFLPQRFKSKFYKQPPIWECSDGKRRWTVGFKSSDSDPMKFEGTRLDKAWFDEEPKKTQIFTSVERGLVDTGGDWTFTATPLLGTAWLKALSERKNVFSVSGRMINNPYLPEEEVVEYAKSLPEDERLVRIEGEYIVFGGRPVFSRSILREIMERAKNNVDPMCGVLEAA